MKYDDDRIKETIVAKVRGLFMAGKDILKGPFIAHNGNVQLDVTICDNEHFNVTYCYYSSMWSWRIRKDEITT